MLVLCNKATDLSKRQDRWDSDVMLTHTEVIHNPWLPVGNLLFSSASDIKTICALFDEVHVIKYLLLG